MLLSEFLKSLLRGGGGTCRPGTAKSIRGWDKIPKELRAIFKTRDTDRAKGFTSVGTISGSEISAWIAVQISTYSTLPSIIQLSL